VITGTSTVAIPATGAAVTRPQTGAITEVSRGCAGQNAEVEQAVDGRYLYIVWIGCGGIGFARSTNDGRTFGQPFQVPGSAGQGFHRSGIGSGLPKYGWDPSITVARDHTVYVAYMLYRNSHVYPVVAISRDHGAAFGHLSRLISPVKNNWGDRDFVAVSPSGTLYVTWDFGRSLKTRYGNIVLQRSANGGKSWSKMTMVTPGFPAHGGGVAGPILAGPGGRLDVGVWVWSGGGIKPYAVPPDHIYFTSSANGGKTWSKMVAVDPGAGRIGYIVTWIDVNLCIDSAGTLYATWDTQHPAGDIGWLSYSTNHGRTWSRAVRVTPDNDNAEHIMAVIAGRPGVVYVGWLSDNSPKGFAQFLRPYSIRHGWLAKPLQVSRQFGNSNVWPGDTIGISLLPPSGHAPRKLQVSWGSAVDGSTSQIFTGTAIANAPSSRSTAEVMDSWRAPLR